MRETTKRGRCWTHAIGVALALLAAAPVARAEVKDVRIARQLGLGYLQLYVMQENKLIEQHAQAAGLGEIGVRYQPIASPATMNDMLVSGNVDMVGCGFTERDRIALPAVKMSIQAALLQMACEQEFGAGKHEQLDHLTVSMSHPDATAAMLSGRSEIAANFSNPPFQFQQLDDPRARRVLSSFDILGGPATVNSIYTTTRLSPAFVEKMLNDPTVRHGITPSNTMKYAVFMFKVGRLRALPASWKDYFFPEAHILMGS